MPDQDCAPALPPAPLTCSARLQHAQGPRSSSCLSHSCGGAQWVPLELICTRNALRALDVQELLRSWGAPALLRQPGPAAERGAHGAFPALRLTGIPVMHTVIPSADFTDCSLSAPPQPAPLKHPQPTMLLHLRSPSFSPLLVPNRYSAFSKSSHSNLSPAHTICK